MRLLQQLFHFHTAGFGHGSLLRHHAGWLGYGDDQQGVETGFCFKSIVPAAQFGERADAKLGHVAANFFREGAEIGDDHFRFAVETQAQGFVLCGDANGAGVEMALARHDAADGDKGRGAESEFIGAEDGADQNVAGEAEAAVHAERDTRAQAGAQQSFVRVAEADLPGQAGVFDGSERRRAGAAIVAADCDDIRAGLGDPRGDHADAGAGDKLYADAGLRIDGAQVVDELREVFDAVNVVVRRRRDQRGAGRGVANARNVLGDFARRKLAAFAWLAALGHFDFELFGANEIFGGDTEAAGGDLLDLARAARRGVEIRIFAAFAGVAAAADLVHRQRESLVRFGAQRAEGHGLRAETLENGFQGFHIFERNWLLRQHFQQIAQEYGSRGFAEFLDRGVVLGLRLTGVRVEAADKLG